MDVSHSWRREKGKQTHTEHQDKTGCYPNSVRSLFRELHLHHLGHQGHSLSLVGICSDHKVSSLKHVSMTYSWHSKHPQLGVQRV